MPTVPVAAAVASGQSQEVPVPEEVERVPAFVMPVGSNIAGVPEPVGHRRVPVARRPGPDNTHTDSGSNTVADSSTGGIGARMILIGQWSS